MRRALKYLGSYKRRMITGYAVKVLGTVAELFLPWIMKRIIDEVVPEVRENGNYTMFIVWGIAMFACAVLALVFNVYANRRAAWTSKEAIRKLRYDLFKKIMTLSGRKTDEIGIPSLISRLTSDSYNIHTFFNIMQRMGIRAPLIIIGGLVLSSTLDGVLTLTLIATLPFVFLIVFIISRRGVPLYAKVQNSVDDMVRVMREDVSGIRVIKALSKEDYERDRFRAANEETVRNELKASGVMAASGPFIGLCLNMGLVLVILVGANRVYTGATLPGTIIAFLNYFTMILNAVIAVNRIFVNFSKASASSKRIFAVMDTENDLPVIKAENTEIKEDTPVIEFKNVWFAYGNDDRTDDDKYVLKNISFKVLSGESLGIIGATGSGKTTIINLLMRFYDVTKGNIYIYGRDIRSYELCELRRLFGVAFQNDVIFADTILENIRFGRELSEKEAELAAKTAASYDFIMEKDGEFEHEAAIRGADFSGGQKQRLLITRAVAGNPNILVLDDSSSALDYKTDAFVRNSISKNYKDTTRVLIAQRVSSVMKMTNILVLDDGEIIGMGSHEKLINECEVYKEIAASQLGSIA